MDPCPLTEGPLQSASSHLDSSNRNRPNPAAANRRATDQWERPGAVGACQSPALRNRKSNTETRARSSRFPVEPSYRTSQINHHAALCPRLPSFSTGQETWPGRPFGRLVGAQSFSADMPVLSKSLTLPRAQGSVRVGEHDRAPATFHREQPIANLDSPVVDSYAADSRSASKGRPVPPSLCETAARSSSNRSGRRLQDPSRAHHDAHVQSQSTAIRGGKSAKFFRAGAVRVDLRQRTRKKNLDRFFW